SGLCRTARENRGVISSKKKTKKKPWRKVRDFKLDYLPAQQKNIKQQSYKGAVLIAVHHPPFSYAPPPKAGGRGGNHGGSPNMLREIDTICKQANVYPHAFISRHAHNYQRYTRTGRFCGDQFHDPFLVVGDNWPKA